MRNPFSRKGNSDLLNEAHTLGLGALSLFENAAEDLAVAADLATQHADQSYDDALALLAERDRATEAAHRYSQAAARIRVLADS